MQQRSGPRKTANLSESVHQQLNMYAIAAVVAVVGMFTLAQPSEAKIVYTPAQVALQQNVPYRLDLDDGAYFFIEAGWVKFMFPPHYVASVTVSTSNGVMGGGLQVPAALTKGAQIGPAQSFFTGMGTMAFYQYFGGHKSHSGPWFNVTDRYLGLSFLGKGGTRYGWARLTVQFDGEVFDATLTGYAYETIAGKSIKAGQRKEADESDDEDDFGPGASLTNPILDTPQPATLDALSMGAPGPSIWRRKETHQSVSFRRSQKEAVILAVDHSPARNLSRKID